MTGVIMKTYLTILSILFLTGGYQAVPANLNVNSLRAAKWVVLIALPVNVSMKKLKINMAQIDWKKNFISSAKQPNFRMKLYDTACNV
jgi:hypothetical protein